MRNRISFAALVLTLIAASAGGQDRSGLMNVGDARINYAVAGRGDAIVLIHGWAQDLDAWDDQVAAFSPNYRVVRYDLRGFGQSSGFADMTADPEDLRILLDSLGIRRAHVVGLSRGARVALDFAVAFPDRVQTLVLEGCSLLADFQPLPPGPRLFETFAQIGRTYGLDSLGKFILASPLAWMPPDRAQAREQMHHMWARYSGRDLLDPHGESGRIPEARMDQLAGIRLPTLIVNGDHEMPILKVVADTLARRIPDARKIVIRDAGHAAHMAQPVPFNKALEEFFGAQPRP